MRWLQENWAQALLITNTAVLLASYIAKLTPTKKDDKLLAKLVQILSISKSHK